MELDLTGLVPATVTPMRRGGEVDEDALRRYIRWLRGFAGLKALAVNMDTGEGPQLLREERRRVLQIYREEVAGRVPVLAGIGGGNNFRALRLGGRGRGGR